MHAKTSYDSRSLVEKKSLALEYLHSHLSLWSSVMETPCLDKSCIWGCGLFSTFSVMLKL